MPPPAIHSRPDPANGEDRALARIVEEVERLSVMPSDSVTAADREFLDRMGRIDDWSGELPLPLVIARCRHSNESTLVRLLDDYDIPLMHEAVASNPAAAPDVIAHLLALPLQGAALLLVAANPAVAEETALQALTQAAARCAGLEWDRLSWSAEGLGAPHWAHLLDLASTHEDPAVLPWFLNLAKACGRVKALGDLSDYPDQQVQVWFAGVTTDPVVMLAAASCGEVPVRAAVAGNPAADAALRAGLMEDPDASVRAAAAVAVLVAAGL